MSLRTTAELREGFLSFFESKDHLRYPSGSVVPPPEDTSTLFTVAGMQPLQPFFLGLREPPAPRLTTAQKVMRAGGKHNDLDDVGSTARHASFFEMLGNFSFGDYFKDGAIELAWEFATEHMRFPPERLWTTVFAGDAELGLAQDDDAIRGWLGVGVPRERIVALPRAENFWQAAETGPCGPNTELYLDRGEELGCGEADCGPGCERCERYLEFWNLVFMELELDGDGRLTPLPKQNVDTGLGFERAAMLLQGVDSIFEIDNMQALMGWVEERTGVGYGTGEHGTKAHRVLADHARASAFLVADGVLPANEGRGYVLRRVIRRAVRFGHQIGLAEFWPLTELVVEQMREWYPELGENRRVIEVTVRAEEERFAETLVRGEKLFDEVAAAGNVSGEDAFRLHDTYGFPLELTRELAGERGLAVDEERFTALMAQQRERSRRATAADGAAIRLPADFTTEFVGYEKLDVLTQIGALEPLEGGRFAAKLRESPFYAESGGQVSDTGSIVHEETGARAELREAIRIGEDQVLVLEGEGFAAGDRVRAVVNWSARFPTSANHTATHLLQAALRAELGDHVRQAGSAVRPELLRFDFTHGQALSQAEREAVERRVNEVIFTNPPVRTFVTPIEEARRLGATALFGERYGDEVRVVEVPDVSRELCGGTHVRTAAEIGAFAILSERSVGAGARRIEAVTSGEAYALLHARAGEADALRAEVERLRKDARNERPVAPTGPTDGDALLATLVAAAKEAGGVRVVAAQADGLDADALLEVSDRVKQKAAPAAVVLGSREDGRVHLVANFDPSLESRGLDAAAIVRQAAALMGGGGGGRATMARAGGKEPEHLPDALAEAERLIVAALS